MLSATEKELHNLDYPFKTVPAMKIAKLAVSSSFQQKYRGIGSLMVEMAIKIAGACNERFFACRFITVDADIEHNKTVLNFNLKTASSPTKKPPTNAGKQSGCEGIFYSGLRYNAMKNAISGTVAQQEMA